MLGRKPVAMTRSLGVLALVVGAVLLLLLVDDGHSKGSLVGTSDDNGFNGTEKFTGDNRLLSRRKRFLLFPVNGNLLFTVAMGKALIFQGPGGHFVIAELDLYHPLPDYRYRISSLKLGQIAMLPPENMPPPPPSMTPTKPPEIEHHDEHELSSVEVKQYLKDHPDAWVPPEYGTEPPPSEPSSPEEPAGHELSSMEVQQYLKDHPGSWVPPEFGKDRSDRFRPGTYNPYVSQSYDKPSFRRKESSPSSTYVHRYIPRYKRSLEVDEAAFNVDHEEEEEDRFNISHHRDWEHFYHYRERRELFHTLESGFGDKFDFPMKSCLMRAICEARSFLLPPGKSMIMDIARIVFSIPTRDGLHDDYSAAMRHQNLDCHELYNDKCPISLLYLVLFGKFVQ